MRSQKSILETATSNILYREVNHRIRYYSTNIYLTLFGEYLLYVRYGSMKNKRATGVKKHYFLTLKDALHAGENIVQKKLQRGYSYECTS